MEFKKVSDRTAKSKKLKLISIVILVILIPLVIYAALFSAFKTNKKLSVNYFQSAENQPEVISEVNSSDNKIKLLMFGDMVAAQPLYDAVKNGTNPFGFIDSEFKGYDLIIGNLETTIEGEKVGNPQDKPYLESSPKEFLKFIRDSGIDLVNTANNHAKDYGPEGILYNIFTANQYGIQTFGTGADNDSAFKPAIVNVKGTRIAFLGFNSAEYAINKADWNEAGTGWFGYTLSTDAIKNAKAQSDFVIVWAHWGDEHTSTVNDWQYTWARHFIDAGADMVIGAHPHVRQPSEQYNGKWIFYSLGNFVFEGMEWDPEAVIGSMLDVTIENKQVTSTNLRSVDINYFGQPKLRP